MLESHITFVRLPPLASAYQLSDESYVRLDLFLSLIVPARVHMLTRRMPFSKACLARDAGPSTVFPSSSGPQLAL